MLQAPRWVKSYVIVSGLSLVVFVLLSILFASQVRIVMRGSTYLEDLRRSQGSENGRSPPSSVRNLQWIFGMDPLWAWPQPRLKPPPGSISTDSIKKSQ